MKYLLYCIFHSLEYQEPETILGVDGQPVVLVSNNGLSAATTRVVHSDLTIDLSRILIYKKVVESFHRACTVIPMRYGCLLEEELRVIQLLEKRFNQFELLLKELRGCEEIGIRILTLKPGIHNSKSEIQNPQPVTHDSQPATPGRAFLAARKAHYTQEKRFCEEMKMVTQRCRAAFTGLFVKCKEEYPTFNPQPSAFHIPFISLYFLVPRKSVGPFRQVFRHISFRESAKLLFSGPWPPYNFAMSDYSKDQPGLPSNNKKKEIC